MEKITRPEKQPLNKAVFTYEEAKIIYLEGLNVATAVYYGCLHSADKFEEMLDRINLIYKIDETKQRR